jgi:hypothetical protein
MSASTVGVVEMGWNYRSVEGNKRLCRNIQKYVWTMYGIKKYMEMRINHFPLFYVVSVENQNELKHCLPVLSHYLKGTYNTIISDSIVGVI